MTASGTTPVADVDGDIVHVPQALVVGFKQKADGSQHFKLVGGPWHGNYVRVYGPYDHIIFPTTKPHGIHPAAYYRITPPIKKDGAWVYVHDHTESLKLEETK